jgi:hypothetical protein
MHPNVTVHQKEKYSDSSNLKPLSSFVLPWVSEVTMTFLIHTKREVKSYSPVQFYWRLHRPAAASQLVTNRNFLRFVSIVMVDVVHKSAPSALHPDDRDGMGLRNVAFRPRHDSWQREGVGLRWCFVGPQGWRCTSVCKQHGCGQCGPTAACGIETCRAFFTCKMSHDFTIRACPWQAQPSCADRFPRNSQTLPAAAAAVGTDPLHRISPKSDSVPFHGPK